MRLPGQYSDAETGFYQNGFRDYVPNLGRYLESDPIGLAASLNNYGYARLNPEDFVDRLGLSSLSPWDDVADRVAGFGGQCSTGPCAKQNYQTATTLTGFLGNGVTAITIAVPKADVPAIGYTDVFANFAAWSNDPTMETSLKLAKSAIGLCKPAAIGMLVEDAAGGLINMYLDARMPMSPAQLQEIGREIRQFHEENPDYMNSNWHD